MEVFFLAGRIFIVYLMFFWYCNDSILSGFGGPDVFLEKVLRKSGQLHHLFW